ncbi:MAG: hypothetical protein JNJ56_12205 [Ignavibacteria bacterium]|nr:hypothetical protein [Ignavibacteria bacterium]
MEEALQYTQLITNIIIIILFIGILIFLFRVISSVKNLTDRVGKFSGEFSDIKPKILETIEKVNKLSENVNSVVTKVNENVDVLETVVYKVKDTADSIIEFEKKIHQRIEPPVMETLSTITAVSAGIKTFIDTWKNKKEVRYTGGNINEDIFEIKEQVEEVNKELDEVNSKLSDLQK